MKQITTLPKSGSLKKRGIAKITPPPVEIQIWPIDRFVLYARTPRKNDAAVDRMCGSIRAFGFKIPCLVRSDGEVIDGHLRLKAARKLGMKEIPVILCDEWTPAQGQGLPTDGEPLGYLGRLGRRNRTRVHLVAAGRGATWTRFRDSTDCGYHQPSHSRGAATLVLTN